MDAHMIEPRCLISTVDSRWSFPDGFAGIAKWFRQRGEMFRQERGLDARAGQAAVACSAVARIDRHMTARKYAHQRPPETQEEAMRAAKVSRPAYHRPGDSPSRAATRLRSGARSQ